MQIEKALINDSFYCLFCLQTKLLRLINLKAKIAMNAKILVFDICVEAIVYLLLHNLYDCTFKSQKNVSSKLFLMCQMS